MTTAEPEQASAPVLEEEDEEEEEDDRPLLYRKVGTKTLEELRKEVGEGEVAVRLGDVQEAFIVSRDMLKMSGTANDLLESLQWQELEFENLPEKGFELACKWMEFWTIHKKHRPWEKEMPLLKGTNRIRGYPELPLLSSLRSGLVPFDAEFIFVHCLERQPWKCSKNLLDVLHVSNHLNIKQLHTTACAALCELFKRCVDLDCTLRVFGEFIDEPLNEDLFKKTVEKFRWLGKKKRSPLSMEMIANGSGPTPIPPPKPRVPRRHVAEDDGDVQMTSSAAAASSSSSGDADHPVQVA